MEAYDYIVVGAGSAGCPLARRLTDNGRFRVLLLDAGPAADRFWVHTPAGMAKLYFDRELNWNFETEPMARLRNRRMYWPRGKGLGGSSLINGMIYIRGHRHDFDSWRDLGNPGWGYDDVLPVFRSIEHFARRSDAYRGQGGPLWISDPVVKMQSSHDFIAAASSLGIPETEDMNGALHDGVGFMQHTIKQGIRQNAFRAFIEPVLHRPNLTVLAGAEAQRILFEGRRATGVEILSGGRTTSVHATREVILSAGSLKSPQLLMLSGIGPAEHLQALGIGVRHHSPGVGQNLQDHFYIHTAFRATPDSSYNSGLTGLRKYAEGLRYLLTGGGYLALGSSQVAAFVKSHPAEPYADLQISFRPMTFSYFPNGTVEVDRYPGLGVSVYQLRPRSTGTVTLRSANPHEPAALTPDFLTDERDIRAIISGIRQIRQIMAAPPMAKRVIAETVPGHDAQSDEQLLDYLQSAGNSAHHQAGTCRMGNDPLAVVDARLRVHGVESLRVVDASIMPHLTSGNTNAPTIMIGARAVDFIIADDVPPMPVSAGR